MDGVYQYNAKLINIGYCCEEVNLGGGGNLHHELVRLLLLTMASQHKIMQ
jgi:hypothetical protein